jgi:hypothetical protein
MRRAKRSAVAVAGLAFTGAMVFASGATGALGAPAEPHHAVAGPTGGGCDNWGDCWDTWGLGGDGW